MLHRRARFADFRQDGAPMLLVLFVLAVQLGPAAHLAAHRNDHTHGGSPAAAHEAAHRAGHPHVHRVEEPADADSAPPGSSDPGPDHGQGTSAHFGLALLDGPPPPDLPPPAEWLAARRTDDARQPLPPVRQTPPARGPPHLDPTR
jgi:hypothetical protein